MHNKYGNDTIKKEAKVISRMFESNHASFAHLKVNKNLVLDQTNAVNMGQQKKIEYLHLEVTENKYSQWT